MDKNRSNGLKIFESSWCHFSEPQLLSVCKRGVCKKTMDILWSDSTNLCSFQIIITVQLILLCKDTKRN